MSGEIDAATIDQSECLRVARLRAIEVLDTGAEPLFDALTQAAALVTGAPIALVTLVDADRQWFKSSVGLDGIRETSRDVSFCAHTILADALMEVPDATRDERFAANPYVTADAGVRFYAGAPIVLADGMRMGALCVVDHVRRTLTPMQRDVLRQLAAAAGQALEQRVLALQHAGALQAQAASDRLRAQNQSRLENTIEAVRAGTFEWHIPDGDLVCNERWAGMLGYRLDELEPLSMARWQELVQPADWLRAMDLMQAHLCNPAVEFECRMRMRHRSGAWIWVSCRGSVVTRAADGTPLVMYGTHVDITGREEAEDRLRASEAMLDRTGRLAGVGGWELDLDSGDITWTAQTCRIHDVPIGYRPTLAEALEFYEPAAREPLQLAIAKSMADGVGWDLELPFRTATGRSLWVRAFGSVEYDAGRPRWLVGAIQDVTLRNRAVRAMETSERRFRKLFEFGLGLICIHDMQGVLVSVNPAAARSLGYSIQEMMGQRLSDFMPEERRGGFGAYLHRITAEGADAGILRLVARDGTRRTWEYRNVIDDDGESKLVLGHAQDVTEREIKERTLHERSVRDPLTSCFNRGFLTDLAAQLKDGDRWGCIAIDLDHFKQVNDTHGHQRGDEVLVAMGCFLIDHLGPTDVVVRVGGDEFLALLKDGDAGRTAAGCQRLLEARGEAPIGFTLGSAVLQAGESLDRMWETADRALYENRARQRR